ncbi:MAG: hypothetical protein AAGJ35_08145 [Myxococcota bacterium]
MLSPIVAGYRFIFPQVSPQQTEAENEAEHELASMGIKVDDEAKTSKGDGLTSGVEGIVKDSKEGAKAVMDALVDQFMVAGGVKTAKKTVLRRGEVGLVTGTQLLAFTCTRRGEEHLGWS